MYLLGFFTKQVTEVDHAQDRRL